MAGKSSAELLGAMVTRFQRRALAETGVKVSMRKMSEELLSRPVPGAVPIAFATSRKPDANALGRWTKPGGRGNWFIPVGRVLEVAQQLRATPAERDALMLARLQELADADPANDILTCGAWVAERVQDLHRLDDDEQLVLTAFRRARAVSPYSMMSPERVANLEHFVGTQAQEHLAELAQKQGDEASDDSESGANASLRARALSVVQKMRHRATPQPLLSAEVLARRFLRQLRRVPK